MIQYVYSIEIGIFAKEAVYLPKTDEHRDCMNIDQAISTAIQYETEIRDLYLQSMKETENEKAKQFFGVLAKEEQHHLDYLNKRLEEWKKEKRINIEEITTIIPSKEKIQDEIGKLHEQMQNKQSTAELDLLHKILDVETKTSNFYKKMAQQMGKKSQKMFENFVAVEEAHKNLVLAEIDCVNGMGFWFHLREFDLEAY